MTQPQKLRLEIPLLLPSLPDIRDRCVKLLIQTLESREGIAAAHVADAATGGTPELCIHYDPDVISLGKVRDIARGAGAKLTDRFGHMLLRVGTKHPRAARTLTAKLKVLKGVVEAEVNASGSVRIEFDREQVEEKDLRTMLSGFGIEDRASLSPGSSTSIKDDGHDHQSHSHPEKLASVSDHTDHAHEHGDGHDHSHGDEKHGKHASGAHEGHDHSGGLFGEKTELIFAAIAGALLLVGWVLESQKLATETVSMAFFVMAYLFGGYFTLLETIDNIKAKRFEIDMLMLVAAAGAAALGQWFEGALLLFLFSMGHSLEHYAMGRARKRSRRWPNSP